MKKINQRKDGFTLIELMVVMAIIAVLSVLIIGAIQLARRASVETTHRSNAKTIQTAMEAFYAKKKAYPSFTSPASFTAFEAILEAELGADAVKLTSTSVCATTSAAAGGGTVSYTAPTYTITPYNYNCDTALTDDAVQLP